MSLKNDLMSGLDDSRNVMRGVLQLIDDDHEVYPDWKIKYVLAYIAGRDESTINAIHAYRSNRQVDSATVQDIDAYISPSVESLQEASYEEVMREWEAIREGLKGMIFDLQDAAITKQIITPWGVNTSVRSLVNDLIELEKEQAEEIMRGMKPKNL